MAEQTQISENLLEQIEPPKISEDLLPVLGDILQPPPQPKK
ncbi:hypothetical protein [Nostoc linckia]|nr:hypothetical protein [Nostoc linckia]